MNDLFVLTGGAIGIALLSYRVTGAVRRYVQRVGMMDVPNARSAHEVPVPRGGGVAIVLCTLVSWLAIAAAGWMDRHWAFSLVAGGGLVATIGWIDDRRGVRALVRLGVHVIAATLVLWGIGGWVRIGFGSIVWSVGSIGVVLGIAGIVWCTNLYNFMDGIDGIAGVEAVHVATTAALISVVIDRMDLAFASAALAAASIGFLLWNWPPARIFMGDIGSGFLGFSIGALAVWSDATGGLSVLGWVALFGVFVVDATLTLVRRLVAGDRWDRAHRQHAYQRLAMAGLGHRFVTLGVVGLNSVLGSGVLATVYFPGLSPWMELALLGLIILVYWQVERRWPAEFGTIETQ